MLEFASCIPIDNGWSGDRKYHVKTQDGIDYLLRIIPPEKCDTQYVIFNFTKQLEQFDLPICKSVALEKHDDGMYLLQEFIFGRDAVDAIPLYTSDEQYAYGLSA